jgi:mRNA interferase MazF
VTRSGYVPERGDAVRIAWNHMAGCDSQGLPVALVLSPAAYNKKVGFALFCPITDRIKGYPFEVSIPGNMKVTGVVLSDEIKSLDWRALKAELICRLPETTVAEVLRKAAVLLSK